MIDYTRSALNENILPSLIELVEIVTSEIGLQDIRLFNEVNESEPDGSVQWQNLTFFPHPFSITGFQKTTEGTLPRVKFSVSNVSNLPNNSQTISAIAFNNQQLLKVPVVRYQVWKEDLYTNKTGFAFDEYRIIGVESDTKLSTTFTLATAVDLPSIKLPLEIIDRRKFPSLPPQQ